MDRADAVRRLARGVLALVRDAAGNPSRGAAGRGHQLPTPRIASLPEHSPDERPRARPSRDGQHCAGRRALRRCSKRSRSPRRGRTPPRAPGTRHARPARTSARGSGLGTSRQAHERRDVGGSRIPRERRAVLDPVLAGQVHRLSAGRGQARRDTTWREIVGGTARRRAPTRHLRAPGPDRRYAPDQRGRRREARDAPRRRGVPHCRSALAHAQRRERRPSAERGPHLAKLVASAPDRLRHRTTGRSESCRW